MPTCVPIKDMRDTAAFANLVETSPEPIIVTKNGYDQFVVLRSRDYDALKDSEAKAQLMSRLSLAEQERAANASLDARESLRSLRERHGL